MQHSQPNRNADPLAVYARLAVVRGTRRQLPLIAAAYEIAITSGLATVSTDRIFRNTEDTSVEVVLTFPVPLHATFCGLELRLGERVLRGKAQPKERARETYEDAMDHGNLAVLHEEVLRGIHQITLGHLAPGREVKITSKWAMPLAVSATGGGLLHIPVTVGDIYGRSPLADVDDLCHGEGLEHAQVRVTTDVGPVRLNGAPAPEQSAAVRLDAPIRIETPAWTPKPLYGVAADGRFVTLVIEPAPIMPVLPTDAAVLVDTSLSMADPATTVDLSRSPHFLETKFDITLNALAKFTRDLEAGARLDIWQFNEDAKKLEGRNLIARLASIDEPYGGTEIGEAINAVLLDHPTRDVLLLTDGKSHEIDVQKAARSGRRFNVLLIGEDSLEANVGHLAALSGGQLLVAVGTEVGAMMARLFAEMRRPHLRAVPIDGPPEKIEALIAGVRITVIWERDVPGTRDNHSAVPVAAVAAALALPRMDESAGIELAVAEGLVSHMTSLILLDETETLKSGLSVLRKIPTRTPFHRIRAIAPLALSRSPRPNQRRRFRSFLDNGKTPEELGDQGVHDDGILPFLRGAVTELRQIHGLIDWVKDSAALETGDLSCLPNWADKLCMEKANLSSVQDLANSFGVSAIIIVVGLLARQEGVANEAAETFARRVLGAAPHSMVQTAQKALG